MLLVLTSSSDGVQLRSCNRGTFLLFLPLLFLLNPKQVHTAEDAAPQCSSNTSDDADEGLGWRENATYDDNQPFPPLPVLLLLVFILLFYFFSRTLLHCRFPNFAWIYRCTSKACYSCLQHANLGCWCWQSLSPGACQEPCRSNHTAADTRLV